MIRIEDLLSREIGLCAASIGSTAIELTVKTRMRDSGCASLQEYVTRVQHDPEELRRLIELIVVSETWFFRDEEAFRTLLSHARGRLTRGHTGRALRVLTVPCATGEEAYSIAITLLEGGLTPASYSIQAFDLSEPAVATARRGVYGKNSFRGAELGRKRAYFEASGSDLRVADQARLSIGFTQGNLLDPELVPSHSQFDVIFCRNVLIYLDRAARSRALDNIFTWLAKDGIVLAGHAEALDNMDPRFQRIAPANPFAYIRRAAVAKEPPEPRTRAASAGQRALPAPTPKRAALQLRPMPPSLEARVPAIKPSEDALAPIAALADRGDLAAAALACERLIANSGPSADAYSLLGVIRQASGDGEAALACFTKALYLNQRHYEALVHLALIHEQRGQQAQASNFRRRAQRIRGEGGQ